MKKKMARVTGSKVRCVVESIISTHWPALLMIMRLEFILLYFSAPRYGALAIVIISYWLRIGSAEAKIRQASEKKKSFTEKSH
jgi:hypothetical protein